MSDNDSGSRRPLMCPEDIVLDQFHRGTLPAATAKAIGRHIAGCVHCGAVAERIRQELELEAELRAAEAALTPQQRDAIMRLATITLGQTHSS